MKQSTLFDILEYPITNNVNNRNTTRNSIRPFPSTNGTKDSASRYNALREMLDNDKIHNFNWEEINTLDSEQYTDKEMTFFDLFSGAGGISVGFRNAGLKKLCSIEIDKDASDTIKRNFVDSFHLNKPIEEVTEREIDDILQGNKVDVICGGPPCNGFSVAGMRKPDDPRNQLFREYIRIVKHLKPQFVFMENVPGIITMENGAIYKEIIKQFAEIGYPDMTVRILEAANYGVPQLRTRAIFIGNRLGIKNPYPKPFLTKNNYKPIESAIDDLKNLPLNDTFNHIGTKHSKEMEKRLSEIPHGGSLYPTFRDAWKRQYKGVPCMAIKENHGGVHVHYELNRVLTAREMARLQTFPDDFIFSGTFKKAYWQIGNAVPCTLAEHIALAIKSQLIRFGKTPNKNV